MELLADNARLLRQRIGVARERLGLPELENYQMTAILRPRWRYACTTGIVLDVLAMRRVSFADADTHVAAVYDWWYVSV